MQSFTCSVFVMEVRISKIVASRSGKVGYISIFSSSNVKDMRNMGKRWELPDSNRVANSSTLFWSRNFNLGEKAISRVITHIQWEQFEIPTGGEHHLTWFEMRVDALLKKESSFFSFTLFSVSSLRNSWMIWGSQVLMIWSSVLLQSAAIFSWRLLQSTGPELLHHKVLTECLHPRERWSHHLSPTHAFFSCPYQHIERSTRSMDENVW